MKIILLLGLLKYGSRKEIKNMIKNGRIKVNNGVISSEKVFVTDDDLIEIDNQEIFHKAHVYLVLNKPKGYISANSDGLHKVVTDLIKAPYDRYFLNICGRLDKDTTGLMILTSDGKMVHKIISPKKEVYKKYLVTLKEPLNNYQVLEEGVRILDGKNNEYLTKKAFVEVIDETHCYISILEGKFHQVKRMFRHIGNEVIELERVMIGNLALKDLSPGEYKEIDPQVLKEKLNL